jgi:hypothetical protein
MAASVFAMTFAAALGEKGFAAECHTLGRQFRLRRQWLSQSRFGFIPPAGNILDEFRDEFLVELLCSLHFHCQLVLKFTTLRQYDHVVNNRGESSSAGLRAEAFHRMVLM